MTEQIPLGWYRDPYGTPSLLRWWDGSQWTEATQPAKSRDAKGEAPPGQRQPSPQMPRRRPMPGWMLAGGAIVVAAIVVVALFATGVIGSGDKPAPSANVPTRANAAGQSPVVGTVSDERGGLAYDQLGGTWQDEPVNSGNSLNHLSFYRGQTAAVMENYEPGRTYYASVFSGELPIAISYRDRGDLKTAAKNLLRKLEPLSYPAHARRDLASKAYTVNGTSAWLLRFQVTFPDARSRGWNFAKEDAVLVLVDRGPSKRPGTYFISIPDSHQNQGDLDLLVTSLKTL